MRARGLLRILGKNHDFLPYSLCVLCGKGFSLYKRIRVATKGAKSSKDYFPHYFSVPFEFFVGKPFLAFGSGSE